MIRPLIEAIYDYRSAYAQETNPALRNNYKLPYLETCALLATDDLLSQLDGANLAPLIASWNSRNNEFNHDKREATNRTDYKAKLDEVFRNNGKAYYHNREHENRSFSREKSEDYPELNRSLSSHSGHSKPREYNHPQKYEGHHKSEYVYTSKYRTDRH